MVRHVNPTAPERTATAPYNFVPLPNKVFTVEDGIDVNGEEVSPWKMHDRFVHGTRSGWIDLTITTLTPLFIRGPESKRGNVWHKRDARLKPEPFTCPNGSPMIPGSSIRGMIRTLVEILSFSKITPVTNKKPFFRSVAADRIGTAYRSRVIRGNRKPEGGYVRRIGNQWTIVPAKEVLRVHRDLLSKLPLNIATGPNPKYFPDWNGQHKPCWFKRDPKKSWKVDKMSFSQENNWEEGTLVLTGSAPRKQYDFVFVGQDKTQSIPIPEGIWRRFHDEDQLTQWQEKAFPKDKPTKGCRKANGHLREGEPVFYLTDESAEDDNNAGGLVFFGRAQMFRFPYDLSPLDLVPEEIKAAGLDMASALFGTADPNVSNRRQPIKSRVFFENAVATAGGPDWFEDVMVPKVLASPKATCFQHYLTQDGKRASKDLTTYLQGDSTTIRGHKLYWHRWDQERGIDAVKEQHNHDSLLEDLRNPNPEDTQHTVITPVKKDVIFKGRIRFDNLTDIELGVLLSALRLPNNCAHRLGMGKSLGLGSIKIDSKLSLVDQTARYRSWEESGVAETEHTYFVRVFEDVILEHARNSQETIEEKMDGLLKITRLQSLFHILDWNGKPHPSETDYMELERFKSRPILPTPHGVLGRKEPSGYEEPPRPAANMEMNLARGHGDETSASRMHTASISTVKPIEKGQTREGKLKRVQDGWVALFDGDSREAAIVNPTKIPADGADGCEAEFYITEQSKKIGIRARFEKLL